jgi:hypothetical protein
MAQERDCALTRASEPELTVIQQEIDAVLLRLDGIVDWARAGNREIRDTELIAAWSPLVRTYLSGHLDRRFLGKLREPFPRFERDTSFHQHALKNAASIAHDDESDLSG